MLHEPAAPSGHDPSSPYKMKLGARLFVVYAAVYAGFVALNVLSPATMEKQILLGLNVAVVYGFGLIVFALALALLYNRRCNRYEAAHEAPAADRKEA